MSIVLFAVNFDQTMAERDRERERNATLASKWSQCQHRNVIESGTYLLLCSLSITRTTTCHSICCFLHSAIQLKHSIHNEQPALLFHILHLFAPFYVIIRNGLCQLHYLLCVSVCVSVWESEIYESSQRSRLCNKCINSGPANGINDMQWLVKRSRFHVTHQSSMRT